MNPQATTRQRKTKRSAGAPPNVYYVYHWNRIIGVLAALALLIGIAVLALYAWSPPATAPTSDVGAETLPVPGMQPEPASHVEARILPPVPAADPEAAGGGEARTLPVPAADLVTPEPVAPYRPETASERFTPEPLPVPDDMAEPATVAPSEDETPAPFETAPPAEDITPAPNAATDASEAPSSRVFLPPDTRVNLRAAPSLTSPVLRILDARADLQLVGTAESFFQVRTAERIVGWISRDYSSLTPYAIADHSGNTE